MNLKKYALSFLALLLVGTTQGLRAQEADNGQTIEVTGLVTDNNKEPLPGVNIVVKDVAGLGVITDIDGKFTIKMQPYQRLVFSFIGYTSKEVLVKEQHYVEVVLEEAQETALDEVVVTATGAQKKLTMTGAVTNVDVSTLKTSTSSLSNALAGNVAGVLARQTSGQPGNNVSEFWI